MRGLQSVKPGTVVVLFPGVWHRYRPTDETGWTEHWIECHGSVFDDAMRTGLIQPQHSLQNTRLINDFTDCYERCHGLACIDALASQDLLSTLALYLLARICHLSRGERGFTKNIDDIVQRAYMLVSLRCHEPMNFKALAEELGVGYSNLRHNFAARVGISLKEHYINTRIQKAQDLLLNTYKPIKEIAEILGFECGSHFTKQFKSKTGNSPGAWRENMIGQKQSKKACLSSNPGKCAD